MTQDNEPSRVDGIRQLVEMSNGRSDVLKCQRNPITDLEDTDFREIERILRRLLRNNGETSVFQ